MAASRHLWVGGLPEGMAEDEIKDRFSKFGRVEGVKLLPQKHPNIGLAAFVDFEDAKSAHAAQSATIKIKGHEIRTNFKSKGVDTRKDQRSRHYYSSPDRGSRKPKSTSSSDSSSSSSSSDSDGSSDSSDSDSSHSASDDHSRRKSDREPVMLKVVNLAARPELVLHDALHHEFSNYTPHPEVRMYGDRDMYSLVRFRNAWECKSALRGAQGLLIFGTKMKISALNKSEFPSGGRMHPPPHPLPGHHGGMLRGPPGHGPMGGPPGMGPTRMQSFPPPKDLDPSATRSLFIGNIPKNLSIYELRDTFQRFGPILDVEIKKMSGNATYGFILFFDLMNAVQAKRCMDGERLAGNKIRVGFGKGTPTKTLWVDGIDPALSDSQLEKHFGKYGKVVRLGVDRQTHTAMVQYDTLDNAKDAIESIRGSYIGASDTRLLADYANRDAKAAFFSQMEGPGGPKPFMQSTGAGGMFMDPMGMGPPWMMHGPRPMPMMAMGMGPPHGPPMEYYYGDPYMEADYYGGMPPFPPPAHMRRYPPGHHPFDAGPGFNNDYEDELRRFYRRREWDKRQENRDKHHRHKDSSSESDDSSDNSNERSSKSKRKLSHSTRLQSTSSKSADDDEPKKRRSREKARDEKQKQDDREAKNPKRKNPESDEGAESDSSDEREKERERARLKSTRRLRESREKRQKNKMKESKNAGSDKEEESKKQDKSSTVSPTNSMSKEAGIKTTLAAKAAEKEEKIGVKKQVQAADGPKPEPKLKKKSKDEREGGKAATKREHSSKKEVTEEALLSSPLEIAPPCKASSRSVMEDFNTVDASLDKVEFNQPPLSSTKVSAVSSSVSEERPKISFELRGRENPVKQDVVVAVLESDFSSGDEFRLDDEEEEPSPVPSSPPPPPPPPETNITKARKVASSVSKAHVPDTKEKAPREARTPKSSLGQTDAAPRLSTIGSKTKEQQPTYSYSDTSSESSSSDYSRRRLSEDLADDYRRGSTESWGKRQKPPDRRGSHDSGRDSYHHRQQAYRISQSPSPPNHEWQTRRRPRSPPPVSQEMRHRRLHSPAHRRLSSPRRRSPQSPPPRRSYSPRADPPPARPRTPIQRPKSTRRARGNESPSHDSQRSWYARRPPSPVTAYNRSPSPPPRSRSPIHRHHVRNHSVSPPPLQSRQTKRPLSPVRRRQDSDSPPSSHSRAVKRPQSPLRRRQDSTHDNPPDSKRRKGDDWQGGSGRTKERHRERDRERERREQAAKPRTPSGSPPLPKSEPKPPKKIAEAESAPSKPRTGSGNIQPPLPKTQSGHSIQPPLPKSDYPSPPSQPPQAPPLPAGQQSQDDLLGLLRRYPVMWQGHLILKSDLAAVQLHFLSGNANLARLSLPVATEANPPNLRIAQRMRLEPAQLEGVEKRIQLNNEHCLLLALPCGRDPEDVQAQTHSLKTSLIAYLLQKQAAGIINVPCQQQQAQTAMHVLHIFPPCPFSQRHLQRVAPDLLSSASEDCHLMIVVATA